MKAIVNLSTSKYWKGQNRLIETLNGKTDAQLLIYKREIDVCAPLHKDNNYGFKAKSIEKAYNLGYRQILWLDASMYVIRDLKPIFDKIDQNGYFFQDSGWMNDRWTNDTAFRYFGTNEGMMLSSGVMGLDLESEIGRKFFNLWYKSMEDGIFNGSHKDHRHDQTAASIIAYKLGMELTPNNTYWQYGKPEESLKHDNILIIANGIV